MPAENESPTDAAPARRRAGELIGIGIAQPPADRSIAAALSRRDQRRVRRLVYRGRPAWDEPSARYALVVAAALQRSLIFSLRVHLVLNVLLVLLFAWSTARAVGREDIVGILVYGAVTAGFLLVAIRMPTWHRNARRAVELNTPLLTSGVDAFTVSPPLPRRTRWLGMAVAGVLYAVVFAGTQLVLDSDQSLGSAVASGVVFGAFMVGVQQVFAARAERRAAGDPGPSR